MAPRAGPISGPIRDCGRRIFSQIFHAQRHRRHIRNATENTAEEILGTLQNAKCASEIRPRILSRRLKGTVFHCFSSLSLSSWPWESVRWIEAKDTHPSDSDRAVRWRVLASGSSWPLEPRRSLRGPISGATVSACQLPPSSGAPWGSGLRTTLRLWGSHSRRLHTVHPCRLASPAVPTDARYAI